MTKIDKLNLKNNVTITHALILRTYNLKINLKFILLFLLYISTSLLISCNSERIDVQMPKVEEKVVEREIRQKETKYIETKKQEVKVNDIITEWGLIFKNVPSQKDLNIFLPNSILRHKKVIDNNFKYDLFWNQLAETSWYTNLPSQIKQNIFNHYANTSCQKDPGSVIPLMNFSIKTKDPIIYKNTLDLLNACKNFSENIKKEITISFLEKGLYGNINHTLLKKWISFLYSSSELPHLSKINHNNINKISPPDEIRRITLIDNHSLKEILRTLIFNKDYDSLYNFLSIFFITYKNNLVNSNSQDENDGNNNNDVNYTNQKIYALIEILFNIYKQYVDTTILQYQSSKKQIFYKNNDNNNNNNNNNNNDDDDIKKDSEKKENQLSIIQIYYSLLKIKEVLSLIFEKFNFPISLEKVLEYVDQLYELNLNAYQKIIAIAKDSDDSLSGLEDINHIIINYTNRNPDNTDTLALDINDTDLLDLISINIKYYKRSNFISKIEKLKNLKSLKEIFQSKIENIFDQQSKINKVILAFQSTFFSLPLFLENNFQFQNKTPTNGDDYPYISFQENAKNYCNILESYGLKIQQIDLDDIKDDTDEVDNNIYQAEKIFPLIKKPGCYKIKNKFDYLKKISFPVANNMHNIQNQSDQRPKILIDTTKTQKSFNISFFSYIEAPYMNLIINKQSLVSLPLMDLSAKIDPIKTIEPIEHSLITFEIGIKINITNDVSYNNIPPISYEYYPYYFYPFIPYEGGKIYYYSNNNKTLNDLEINLFYLSLKLPNNNISNIDLNSQIKRIKIPRGQNSPPKYLTINEKGNVTPFYIHKNKEKVSKNDYNVILSYEINENEYISIAFKMDQNFISSLTKEEIDLLNKYKENTAPYKQGYPKIKVPVIIDNQEEDLSLYLFHQIINDLCSI